MRKLIHWEILVSSILIALFMYGCTPAPTPASAEPLPASTPTLEANMPLPTDAPQTIADVEELAGFDVKEPTYLPTGVSFDFATYQPLPHPNVTLHFKLVHETYGDMGAFFQIVQEPQTEALPNPTACSATETDCEIIEVEDVIVKYRLTAPTESLMWEADGFSFQLLRTAGEPDKIYKDELLKVVGSME